MRFLAHELRALAQFLPQDVSLFARDYRDVRVSLEEREIWEVVARFRS